MSRPLCLGEMCHSRMRVGSANARDNALKASKNVALPMTMRALACHRENGTCSIRASRLAASAALGRVRSLSRPSAPTGPSMEFTGSRSPLTDELRRQFLLAKFSLDRFDVGFHGSQRHVPCIVAVQPTRVLVPAFHPGIGAGNCLDPRSAGFAMSFETAEGAFDIFSAGLVQTARQDGCILNRRRSSFRPVWGH